MVIGLMSRLALVALGVVIAAVMWFLTSLSYPDEISDAFTLLIAIVHWLARVGALLVSVLIIAAGIWGRPMKQKDIENTNWSSHR